MSDDEYISGSSSPYSDERSAPSAESSDDELSAPLTESGDSGESSSESDDALERSITVRDIGVPAPVLDEKTKRAIAARRVWKSQGAVTREQYCRLKTAVPRAAQDMIVSLRKGGHTRKSIVQELGAKGHRVTEYGVKRVLRVYSFDPDAFDVDDYGIVIVRK